MRPASGGPVPSNLLAGETAGFPLGLLPGLPVGPGGSLLGSQQLPGLLQLLGNLRSCEIAAQGRVRHAVVASELPHRLAGGDACVPIWTAYMNRIAGLVPAVDWKRPDDVIPRQIDPESGMLATPSCPQPRPRIFLARTDPASSCPFPARRRRPPRQGNRERDAGLVLRQRGDR